jgi:hypothetical protein
MFIVLYQYCLQFTQLTEVPITAHVVSKGFLSKERESWFVNAQRQIWHEYLGQEQVQQVNIKMIQI